MESWRILGGQIESMPLTLSQQDSSQKVKRKWFNSPSLSMSITTINTNRYTIDTSDQETHIQLVPGQHISLVMNSWTPRDISVIKMHTKLTKLWKYLKSFFTLVHTTNRYSLINLQLGLIAKTTSMTGSTNLLMSKTFALGDTREADCIILREMDTWSKTQKHTPIHMTLSMTHNFVCRSTTEWSLRTRRIKRILTRDPSEICKD